MVSSRRFQSFALAVVGTLTTVVLLHTFAAHTSIKLIPAFVGNYTGLIGNGTLGRYVPDRIWWTSETHLEPKFAYAQYATNPQYFCNALINSDLLFGYGTTADVVVMYPESWNSLPSESRESKILSHASKEYPELRLVPIPLVSTSKGDRTWQYSLTKFNAFRLTEYSRVMYFDSDSMVLNKMDHYFLAPLSRLAIPRAYWLGSEGQSLAEQTVCSHVMLLQPDDYTYNAIMDEANQSGDFDMEVINHLFNNSAMILPHRRLALLSGEFRAKNHRKYLSDEPDADWNAMGEISRSVLVHFSDWPLPKPWMPRTSAQWDAALPECDPNEKARDDRPLCADRVMWTGLYGDYDRAKERICQKL